MTYAQMLTSDRPRREVRAPRWAVTLTLFLVVGIYSFHAAPSASANSPWWHVDSGARPTNLWLPASERQELAAGEAESITLVKVNGAPAACIGLFCAFLGMENSETAAQLQTHLEAPAAYGSGGAAVAETGPGSRKFIVDSVGPMAGRLVSPLETEFGGSSKILREGGSGRLIVTLTNVGNAPIDGGIRTVTIRDRLGSGLAAYKAEGFAGVSGNAGPVQCSLATAEVVCTFSSELPEYEAIEIEIWASVEDPKVTPGAISVSGGGAPSASAEQTITVDEEKAQFGIQSFYMRSEEPGGVATTQAGAHPYQLTTSIQLNVGPVSPPGAQRVDSIVEQPALPRNFRFKLPPGLIGNPSATPTCSFEEFTSPPPKPWISNSQGSANRCSPLTAVGVASITIIEPGSIKFNRFAVPIFNLEPANGSPARFGFYIANVAVTIDASIDGDESYRVTAVSGNASTLAEVLAVTATFWGNPGDSSHDKARGWGCLAITDLPPSECSRPAGISTKAFLRQPVSCSSPLGFEFELEPWGVPLGTDVSRARTESEAPRACNNVPFNPAIRATPTSKQTKVTSGLNFELDLPNSGLDNPSGISEAEPKMIEVKLPEGMVANPSQADGLAVCTSADFARETLTSKPGEGCPEAAKIGTVFARTPLLEEPVEGSLYVAAPHDNPFDSLLALYVVARVPSRGVIVKQAGEVEPDPLTGQLRSTFDQLPQVPYSSFQVDFREGPRAPLVTPPTCGQYQTVGTFVPWSASNLDDPGPGDILSVSSPLSVNGGPGGSACPAGSPFAPRFVAGSESNAAGHYSPFSVRVTRSDSEQEVRRISVKLPPGVTGKIAGVARCSDGAIANARSREHDGGGAQEQADPSCPAGSRIGETLVGSGVGTTQVYVPGQLYLAGPYDGAPLSVVAITPAVVGPFDVGTVVVREALRVNPVTAEVTIDAGAESLPRIIDGIPVQIRDIRIKADRPQFTLNPTSCEPTSTIGTIGGESQNADVGSRYQAADCASLGFKPRLVLRLKGGARRGKNPALEAVYKPRAADANSSRIAVRLPHSEFLDQSHIRTVCTRVQFNAGAGNGAQCPKGAIYGRAKAFTPLLDEPLEGPVFLRSSSNPLPDMVLALHGLVDFQAVGRIDSVNGGIRNTFDFVPDVPIAKVVLNLQGGRKGLLVNSTNICNAPHRAVTSLTGHNGRRSEIKPLVQPRCPKEKKRKRGNHARR